MARKKDKDQRRKKKASNIVRVGKLCRVPGTIFVEGKKVFEEYDLLPIVAIPICKTLRKIIATGIPK